MKKMWKRFVSLLLACTLLAGMLPLSASAAVSAPGEGSEQYKYAKGILDELNESIEGSESEYDLIGPASLGDSELYTYLLTRYYILEGTTEVIVDNQYVIVPGVDMTDGNMPDYDSSEDGQPWVSANASAVYIADGVTGIGSHAFNGMDTLEKVVFQDASKLTYVGSYAFSGDNKAQFTDEGNSNAGGDDPTRILDLSHVEKMGENAFYNCDGIKGVELSGSITAVETKEEGGTEEINHKIPNYAFGSCNALTSITVPEGIETIGTAAFAGCTQASSITLPDSLVTIGDRAFACSIDGDNKQLTALTIPENVVTIGASAFYGYTALTTVTVESTKLDKPGDAAFGNSAVNAYATTTTITDAESGITYEDVTVGTQFYTPNNAIKELFENEYNCYLGDLTPLEYAATVKATCEKNGYHVYRLTITSIENAEGQHPVVESRVTIPAVEHNYEGAPDRDATCTLPGYHVQVCTNKGNGLVDTCEAPEKLTPIEGEPRLGHSYTNITVKNPGIAADNTGDTVVTYTCANYSENEEENRHDGGVSPSYSWEIKATTLTASTTQTLGHLTLPAATGKGNAIAAELAWANGVNTEELLQQGSHDVQVKLKITGAPNQFADYLDKNFTIRVQVAREPLDFSKVEFQNATRYVGRENGKFEVIGMPTDTEITNTEYSDDGGKTWDTQAPAEDDADDQGKYLVRVTFKYDNDKYLISENPALRPGKEYTLEAETAGTGTITGTYEVRSLTAADLKATTINGLVYDTKEKATVRVEGLPKDAKVEVVWTENGQSQSEEYTATNPVLDVAYITNAGEYDVTITVTHGSFDGDSATVTAKGVIAKQTVETPVAKSGLDPYTPTVEQTGVPDSRDESIYTITGNKAIDAGTHTATAELVDKNNYKWSRGDEQETGTVTIPFTILKHSLQKPVLSQTSYVFDNQEKAPLTNLNEELTYTYDTDGKLSATWKLYPDSVAYTATNAQKTDAETYKVTVALSDPQNYQWTGGGTDSYDLTWSITPMQVIAPTVTVTSPVTYDGQPYNSESKEITFGEHSENSGNILKLGSEHKYYRLSSGGTALSEAPTNAGTYYVQVDFDFKDDLNSNNYTITGNNRRPFRIEKAELTLTAPTENLSVTYTGSDLTVPAPQVEGLQKDDTASDYSLVYTYTIGESEVTQRQTGELKLSQVGTYHISVSVSRECTNYTSNTVEYVFTISTANQTVKLTGEGLQGDGSAEDPYTISKTLGNDPFTVTGRGYVGETETNAAITYESSNPDTASVDGNGQVTLKKATAEGEPVTITVTAAGSANYQEATASYTITVGKGTPEIQAGDKEIPYDGKQLEKSDYQAIVSGVEGAVAPSGELSYQFYQTEEAANNDAEKGKIDAPSAVGDYWLRVSYPGDANYLPAHKVVKVTITNADLLVTPHPYNKEYDGIGHAPATFTVKGVGGAALGTNDYTVYFVKKEGQYADIAPEAEAEGVWNNQLTVQDVADSGQFWYKIVADSYDPYVGEEPITATVNPKPLEIERKVTARKPYDGTKEAIVNIGELKTGVDGEEINVTETYAEYDSAEVDASSITITYTLKAGENTNLANYTVSTDGGKITDGLGTETVTTVDGIPVGITPAPITVAISNQSSVYDGSAPTVSNVKDTDWKVTDGEIYQLVPDTEDNLGIALSIASGSKDAGTYAITGEWTNSNYDVIFTGSWTGEDENKDHAGIYTIDPRPIKVEISNADGFYGDDPDVAMSESNVTLTDVTNTEDVSEDGLVQGEDIYTVFTGLMLRTNASNTSSVKDSYIIYPMKNGSQIQVPTTPTQLGNYNVTFTNNGTYTVKPRPITITIVDHSSVYGAEIDGGIAKPVSGTDYTVAITEGNTVTTGGAIVNKDDLGIALSTTAKKGDNAGTYPISGEAKAESSVVSNYAITWKGENPFTGEGKPDSTKATYTVEKAELTVKAKQTAVYAQYGQETANPLTFTNASTGEEITVDDSNYETLENAVTYTLNPADSLTMETENKAEGKFTVNVTDTTVTVEVNVAETDNFKAATMITYAVYTSASGSLTVDLPFADLTYTSEEQKLLTGAPTLPDGVVIRYKLGEKGTWTKYSDEAPNNWQSLVGTGAGDYTVYWETKAGGNYNASSGHETTEIKKADLSVTYTGLNDSEVILVLSEMGDTYTIPLDLTGNKGYTHSNGDGVTFLSGNTDVAIAKNSTATLELRGVAGEAKITINCPGDNNYNPGTFTFTVKVTDQKAEIKYNITGATTTYNGQPQTIAVNVTAPASGATVMYWNESTNAYDQTEPPAYTNVQEGGYPIKFQITAPGYKTEEGTATLTIEPKDIKECQVEGIAASYTFVNKPIEPQTVEVVDGSVILTKNTDYTLEYGANQEVGEDTGTVTIKGKGNYTGKVTEYFDIIPVDGSSGMTASIDPAYDTYNSPGNTATVTVTHQTGTDSHEVTLTAENASYTITATDLVTGQAITDHGATGTGDTLTFTKPAIYDITLTLTGDHRGEFHLSYTLLPLSNEDGGLTLTVDDETQKVFTYGDRIPEEEATITVTADGNIVTDQCTLNYEYTGFDQTTVSGDYSPSVLKNAGVYTVTATPTEGSTITGTGTFTFLILQRDLSKATLTVEDGSLVYNQTAQEPSVTVAVTGNPTADDYTITYYNNVNASNAAKAVVTAKGNNFTGSQTAEFTIAPKEITADMVQDIPDQYYTGNEVIPPVTITDGNYTLILGYDYTTACTNKGPGAAKVTITGIGNYTGTTTKDFVIKSEGAPEPSERFDLAVRPSQWTWKDDLTNLDLSVTFGTDKELTLGTEYTLSINNEVYGDAAGETKEQAIEAIKSLKPSEYTITATGVGAYNGSTDTETVTIQKIQPTVTVTATPNSLSGGGKVTLTLKGEKLPNGTDLKTRLSVTAKNDSDVTLEDLHIQWPEDGSLTAELTLPNTNETYTFTLTFTGNEYYEAATASEQVVVAQQIISGGGGGPVEDQPADPDDTGVSDWLNTKDHLAYLAGYPGGTFGPDQNMTRAEAAQMFYNLLLEKDVEITVEFEDVPADAWYAKPVNTLASLGILSGVGNGRFDPERSITRAEFTVIAMKFANTSGGGVNIFSDVNEDDWFYSAVVDSTQYGWINGYPDGTFRPEATISRAEVTVIVNHMLGRAADRPYVIAHEEELNTFGDVNRGHWGYFHIAEATNAHEYHTEDGTESWTGLS